MLAKLLGPTEPGTSSKRPDIGQTAQCQDSSQDVQVPVHAPAGGRRVRSGSSSSNSTSDIGATQVTSVEDPRLHRGASYMGPPPDKYTIAPRRSSIARRGSDVAVNVAAEAIAPPGIAPSASFSAVPADIAAPLTPDRSAVMPPVSRALSDEALVKSASGSPLLSSTAAVRQTRRRSAELRHGAAGEAPRRVNIWGGSGSDAAVRFSMPGGLASAPLAVVNHAYPMLAAREGPGSGSAAHSLGEAPRPQGRLSSGGPADADRAIASLEAASARLPFMARVHIRAKLLEERPGLTREQANALAGLDQPIASVPSTSPSAPLRPAYRAGSFRAALAGSIATSGGATPRGRVVLASIQGGALPSDALPVAPVPDVGVETRELLRTLIDMVGRQQRQIDTLTAALGATRPER